MRVASFPIALLRMIIFIFSTFFGRLIVGVLLLVIGIVYGLGSHNVAYQLVQQQGPTDLIYGNALQGEDYYYHVDGTNAYYDIHAADFSPFPVPGTFTNKNVLLRIEEGSTGSVSGTLNDGTTFSGIGYKVVQFVLVDTQGQQNFTTEEYRDHPDGYYDNQWIVGGIAAGLGFLLIAITVLLRIFSILSGNSKVSTDKSFVSLNSTPRSTWSSSFLLSWRAPRFRNPATPNDLAK